MVIIIQFYSLFILLDNAKLSKFSIIEESSPKKIRMANLAIILSHTVNGVAEIHSNILKNEIFKDFSDYFPGKFINITNGITSRRYFYSYS
jgi:starch phosphorylase